MFKFPQGRDIAPKPSTAQCVGKKEINTPRSPHLHNPLGMMHRESHRAGEAAHASCHYAMLNANNTTS